MSWSLGMSEQSGLSCTSSFGLSWFVLGHSKLGLRFHGGNILRVVADLLLV